MTKHITISGLIFMLLSVFGNAQDISYHFDEATGGWGTTSTESFMVVTTISTTGAFLGIESNSISREKASKLGFSNPYGNYVKTIFKNTAAHRAGILPFDYIYGIGEYRTTRQSSLTDLLEEYEANDWVDLHLIRGSQRMTVQAQLDQEKKVENVKKSKGNDLDGVRVNVVKKSTAMAMGMKDGDKITKINDFPILDWKDVITAISTLQPNQEISVTFKRDGKMMSRSRSIKSYQETRANEPLASTGNWNDKIYAENNDQSNQRHHESAFLGVNVADISRLKAEKLGFDNPYGTYVSSVIKNSAADKGGIKPLDYIYGIDEYRVGDSQKLSNILAKFRAGDNATILVSRKNQRKSFQVQFGSRDDKYGQKKKRNKCEDPFLGITSSSRGRIEIPGVRVNTVSNATSKDVGMENGDIITKINGYRMVDWTDISIAINMMQPGEIITIDYVRDGRKSSGSTSIKSYADTKNCADCNCYQKNGTRLNNSDNDDDRFTFNNRKDENVEISIENVDAKDFSEFSIKGANGSSNNLIINNLKIITKPNEGMFELSFNLPSNGETVVKVFNDDGRNIYEYDLGSFSGEFLDELNLMQNGKGAYLLNISQDGDVMIKKIVIR
jgi:S1-C subfamily serine protease